MLLRCMVPLLLLSACATPETVLKHPKTGQTAICGGSTTGSMVGGMIGYHIEKGYDDNCVADHIALGFEQIYPKPQ